MGLLTQLAYAYDSMYYDTPTPEVSSGTVLAFLAAFLLIYIIVFVVAYVISAFFLSRVFKKAGVEVWKAWVPIYNVWTVLELGGQKGFWAILAIVPVVNIVSAVFIYTAMYYIGLGFGKQGPFVLFAIFLPLVWIIWLAVDDSKWNGAVVVINGQTPAYQPPTVTPPTPPAAVS